MTKMYGTTWCGDCHRARKVLEELNEQFTWIDVDKDPAARAYLVQTVGKVKVPLIVFEDGSTLVEPSNEVLTRKVQEMRERISS